MEWPSRLAVPVASDLLISLAVREKKVKNLISTFPASFTSQVSVMVRLTQHYGSHAGMCV